MSYGMRFGTLVKRSENTTAVEAEWNMKIWQSGIQLANASCEYTFHADKGYGTKVKMTSERSEFLIMVTIKKWIIT